MRNVAVKKQASPAGSSSLVRVDSDEVERKLSLPARLLCQTTTEESRNREDSPQPQAVAGRLEIRMLDPSSQHPQSDFNDRNSQALYLATAPTGGVIDKSFTSVATNNIVPGIVEDTSSIFFDAQTTKGDTTVCQIPPSIGNNSTTINEADAAANVDANTERSNDDENESFHSPVATNLMRGSKSPQQNRRIGTVAPQLEMPSDAKNLSGLISTEDVEQVERKIGKHFRSKTEEDGDDEESYKMFPDYQVLSEQMDDEHRKISIISLNDLSAAFHASSRIRTPRPSPPPEDQAAAISTVEQQDERSHSAKLVSGYLSSHMLNSTDGGEAAATEREQRFDQSEEEYPGSCRRKRQGVEKYISDNSQLNLQFERRRSYRPQSSDVSGMSSLHHSPTLRQRSSIAMMPDSYTSQQSFLESRARPSLQVSPSSSSLNRVESSFEIGRVRSSPSLALAPSAGRFPFHYTPSLPPGNPPTLRELDARYFNFIIFSMNSLKLYS